MPPEPSGQSPFASPDSSGAGTPVADGPEPPRLGILHLMVLTACVAAWMGAMRSLVLAAEGGTLLDSDPFLATAGTLYGIGGGAALAGLILLVARRLRRIRFPVHPGEYLLTYCAVGAVLQAAVYPIYLAMAHLDFSSGSTMPFFVILPLATFVINVAFFIWALIGVKRRRWRVFLLSIPVCHVVGYGLMGVTASLAGPGAIFYVVQNVAPLVASVVLAVVVIQDRLEGRRYPWSHWMGIALRLWFDVVRIVSLVWMILMWERGS